MSKIALDQSLMSPMGACLFFSYIKLMDGFQVFAVGQTLQVRHLVELRLTARGTQTEPCVLHRRSSYRPA